MCGSSLVARCAGVGRHVWLGGAGRRLHHWLGGVESAPPRGTRRKFLCLRALLFAAAPTAVLWPAMSCIRASVSRQLDPQVRRSRSRRRHARAPGPRREPMVAADRLVQSAVPIACCSLLCSPRRVRRTSDTTKAGTSACASPSSDANLAGGLTTPIFRRALCFFVFGVPISSFLSP